MFVIIEGPNGSGKTTLVNMFKNDGHKIYSSPNSTVLSKYLRPPCRGTDQFDNLSGFVKFLLFSAARFDEFEKIVKNKSENEMVIFDRWWMSTFVYQCILDKCVDVSFFEKTIHVDEKISLVVLLNAKPETLINRIYKERNLNPSHGFCSWTDSIDVDRMESISNIYNDELYKFLINKNIPVLKLDTTNYKQEEVYNQVKELLSEYFSKLNVNC